MIEQHLEEAEFSEELIRSYVTGCAEVGVGLHTVTEKILKDSKKPVILIPSRGAVPIFLLAQDSLRVLDPENILIDPRIVGYYPRRVFEFLSHGRINKSPGHFLHGDGKDRSPENVAENPRKTKVDVILYPCTSDVTTEPDHAEWLAKTLRDSYSKVFRNLVFRDDLALPDLNWHLFLMSKIHLGSVVSKPTPKWEEVVSQLTGYTQRTARVGGYDYFRQSSRRYYDFICFFGT